MRGRSPASAPIVPVLQCSQSRQEFHGDCQHSRSRAHHARDRHVALWRARQGLAGRGVGIHCAACGQPIAPIDIEFDVELMSGPALRLHRVCHEIWREECDSLLPR